MSDFDFTPRMVGEHALFDTGRQDADAAEKLFPNQGLHQGARAFALAHPRAVQYLEQAPVLVFGATFGGPGVRRVNALYMSHKVTPLCARGAKLSEVMRTFDLPLPLRRISASILCPKIRETLRDLSGLPPEVLGRIIPERSGQQSRWLLGLHRWRNRMTERRRPAAHLFAWAAEAGSKANPPLQAYADMADFAASEEPFNPAWGWKRAAEEADLWHDRLAADKVTGRLRIKPDWQIDMGRHPDVEVVDGLKFVALRTPAAIATEGGTMRHCVASYIPNVMHGDCHIISVQRGREHVATLELRRDWSVAQLKGKFNASPDREARLAADQYAAAVRRVAREGFQP